MADLNSEEMEPVIEARVSQLILHPKDCAFVLWHEEMRKRLRSQFLQMNAVANQQSVD